MVKVLVLAGGTNESRFTEGKVVLMRRILMLLTVVAMVALMLTVMAAPAFAISQQGLNKYCDNGVEHKPAQAKGGPICIF